MISHYFSGTGKYYVNAITSGLGTVVCFISCMVLIPKYGLYGAAISASLSYIVTSIALGLYFLKEHPFKWRDFLPSKLDWVLLVSEIKKNNVRDKRDN